MGNRLSLFLVTALFLGSAVFAATESPTYTGEQKAVHSFMEALFSESKLVNDSDAAKKSKARGSIDSAMDWDSIASKCLGAAEWRKTSKANRKQFSDLLREVIILSAFDRLDKFWTDSTEYKFTKIDVTGKTAHVAVQFIIDEEPFLLEYYLSKGSSKWLIEDIAYEEFKYSENINEQIGAFLKEFKFAKLLDKLRKRRDELKEDKKTKPTKKG